MLSQLLDRLELPSDWVALLNGSILTLETVETNLPLYLLLDVHSGVDSAQYDILNPVALPV